MQRVALITGGAGGLGLASAKRLAQDGLTVAIADFDADQAATAAAMLPGSGHIGLRCDVTDEASVRAAFDTVQQKIAAVTVLACFAGILSTSPKPGRNATTAITLDEWNRVMQVNAGGTFLCVREFLQRTTAPLEHGRIITVSSLAGQVGGFQAGAAYSASKGAVLAFSKVAAREAAALGITVNIIAPGPIDTAMLAQTVPAERAGEKYGALAAVPLGRIGVPDEIASAVSYLVSPGAAFVTGATLDVNGGILMR